MLSTYKYQGVTWVDLEAPTEDELMHVLEEYNVPEGLLHDLMTETLLSRVDTYKEMLYLVLHFPRVHNEKKMPDLEIDFIVGKNFLITVHYEFSNAIHDFAKRLEVDVMLARKIPGTHAGHLFHSLIIESYHQASSKLNDLYQMMEHVKDQIFDGHEDKMVTELSLINRKILDFRQAIRFHSGILDSYEKESFKLFGEEYSYYVRSIRSEYHKIIGVLEGHRDLLIDLRETNDSLLSAKTNKTMRILTIMSFTTFPLTLIATLVAMITDVHIISTFAQFAYISSALLLIGVLILLHFKNRKWLL